MVALVHALPLNVLIVGCPAENSKLIEETLQNAGTSPKFVHSGTHDEFKTLLGSDVDLVLIDASDKAIGTEVLVALRQIESDIPSIVIGDTDTEEAASTWLIQGANDYVIRSQPWPLTQAVNRARENKRSKIERAQTEEDLRVRNRELAVLVDVARILAQPMSLEERSTAFLESGMRIAGGDSATLRVPDQNGGMRLLARAGGARSERPQVQLNPQGLSAAAFQQGAIVVSNDYPNHPLAEKSAIEQGSKSVISLPVSNNGEVLGTMTVVSKEENHFLPETVRILTTLVSGAGMLLENARLSSNLRASGAEMLLADQVAERLASTIDFNQVFEGFSEEARDLVDFDQATIFTIVHDAELVVVNRHLTTADTKLESRKTWDLTGTQSEQVALTGETLIQDDLSKADGFSTSHHLINNGLRSSIVTPLVYNNRVIGTMYLASKNIGAFGLREQSILERLARQIAPSVENARLYEESVSRTAQLECLLNLANILGQTISYQEKVTKMLETLVEVAEAVSARFRIPNADGTELILTASVGIPESPDIKRPKVLGEGSLVFKAFKQGTPLVMYDYQNTPGALASLAKRGHRSVVLLPIGRGPNPQAMVSVDSNKLGHFTPDRMRLLTAIGEGLGSLLENANLQEQIEAGEAELEMADQVAKIITSTLDIEQEYERFALELKKLVDFDRASLLGLNPDASSYTITNTWGIDIPALRIGSVVPLDGTTLQRSLATEKRTIWQQWAISHDFPIHPGLTEGGLQSRVLAPLISNDQVIGALTVLSTKEDAFGPRERRIIERLAGQIAPAVANARLFREAQERNFEIQRLNESTNRILASNPSALAVLHGASRDVISVNDAFCQSFKLEKTAVEGKPLGDVLEWSELDRFIIESLSSGDGEGPKEVHYQGRGEAERWYLISTALLLADDTLASEEEVLLVLSDVTEQKLQQVRFQEQSRLASVGQLAAGVAHEINNPLAAIHGLSELLEMDSPSEQVKQDARKIQESVQRAAKIVQNLLSFARDRTPEKQYVDVASIVTQALELKANTFRLNNIKVGTNHSSKVPHTMVDENQMMQVILNILTNAEQAIVACCDHGEVKTRTRLLKGKIRISISNNGLAIPQTDLPRIFDPFFTTKEVGEGTGLGLSICYGILQEHGGDLWVENNKSIGATFHIDLPVLSPVLSNQGSTEHRNTDTESPSASNQSVLVVEDEEGLRHNLFRILSADGHDVSTASDGNTAWELIQKTEFDLIIADLRMPGIGGQELFQMAKESSLDLANKFVFMTGDSISSDASSFLESTRSPILHKPFEMKEIRRLFKSKATTTR